MPSETDTDGKPSLPETIFGSVAHQDALRCLLADDDLLLPESAVKAATFWPTMRICGLPGVYLNFRYKGDEIDIVAELRQSFGGCRQHRRPPHPFLFAL